jgi:hypothetical protein
MKTELALSINRANEVARYFFEVILVRIAQSVVESDICFRCLIWVFEQSARR